MKENWALSASSTQEVLYLPQFAADDDPGTRWSSTADDPEWLQIDFGRQAAFAGLEIHWEKAFASAYRVDTSADGEAWQTVYGTEKGNGKTDYLYFAPVTARYARITGTERATGWGYSIWEIDAVNPSAFPRVALGTNLPDSVHVLFDGMKDSFLQFPESALERLTIDLREEKALAGMRIDWGESFARQIVLQHSQDRKHWTKTAGIERGTGQLDVLLSEPFEARYLMLDFEPAQTNPLEIAELTLYGPGEALTPLARYRVAAEKALPGLYPDHLRDQQTYWTVLGIPKDAAESLFDEYGNLEPTAKAPSLMPYLYVDGQLYGAHDTERVEQSLAEGYLPLPGASWRGPQPALDIQAYTWGEVGDAATFVRYRLSNDTSHPVKGSFYLAVRPVQINPPWQYGGLSFIDEIEGKPATNGYTVRVNGSPYLVSLTAPDGFGVQRFDYGDIVERIRENTLPSHQSLDSTNGLLSGALRYNLKLAPGETRTIVIAAPLHENPGLVKTFLADTGTPGKAFEQRYHELRKRWERWINGPHIQLPEKAITDTLKSQVAYILINSDADAIQPGSRQYERSWIRDGAMTSEALLRMGHFDAVRDFIEWYAHFITPEGMVPPSFRADDPLDAGPGTGIEWDGQGAFIYAVMEYYRFTGDKAFVRKHFDAMRRAMQFLVKLREETMAPGYMTNDPPSSRFVGILSKSISHEGYYPEMHSYWDDFWALKGWRDGQEAALLIGETNVAAWAEAEYRKLRTALSSSIRQTIDAKNIAYIPGCAEKGDFDPTSTSIAFHPCDEAELLPGRQVKQTYDRYWAEVQKRLTPGWRSGFTPYEVRNISALIALDREGQAHKLLDFLMDCRRPAAWNHLAEVVIGDPRTGSYIGDMPHTWVGSGLINAVSRMLVRNETNRLVLLDGAPDAWLVNGGIQINNQPTHFGPLDFSAAVSNNVLTVDLACPTPPPEGYILHWAGRTRPAKVEVDGTEWPHFSAESCTVPAGTAQVRAMWQ